MSISRSDEGIVIDINIKAIIIKKYDTLFL